MARKATQKPAEDISATADVEIVQEATENLDKLNKHLAKIDATYGDGLPYDPQRLINETIFYLQQSADAMLEAGKRLVVLKEHEQHGSFLSTLERIGVHPRTAQQMMKAAIKFGGEKTKAFSHLGKSKLFELMIEDDENIEALAEGGTLAGYTLDEIDKMSVRELQNALRKERESHKQDKEIHEQIAAKKDQKINELDKELRKRDNIPADERGNDLSQRLERATVHTIGELLGLEAIVREALAWDQAPQHLKNACDQAANRIHTALDEMRGRLALGDLAHEPEDDAWIAEVNAMDLSLSDEQ